MIAATVDAVTADTSHSDAASDGEAFRRNQAARRAIEGRRPSRHGGGAAALLVVRNGDQIELLPHAADTWALTFDEAGAAELRDALTELLALGEWA